MSRLGEKHQCECILGDFDLVGSNSAMLIVGLIEFDIDALV